MAVPSNTLTFPPLAGVADHHRPSPMHLPSMTDVAAELDDSWPIRIVGPLALGDCEECPDGDLPVTGAIATVVAHDPHAFGYLTQACAFHLPGAVRHYKRHGWPMTVEIPTCSPQWFTRTDRETFYALDEARGVAVTRSYPTLAWAAWDVTDGVPTLLRTFPADSGDAHSRLDAECWAQDRAARIAADEHEAASVPTVALPVVTETKKAA